MKYLIILLALLTQVSAKNPELPPKPEHYFNDYAGIVSTAVAEAQDARLVKLEERTGVEFVVAVFPQYDSDDDYAMYCTQVASSWGIGKKKEDNGVVLFIFLKDRDGKTRTQLVTGFGVEEAIPDATAKTIVDLEIRPHVRAAKAAKKFADQQAEWDAAVVNGVNGVIAALNHSYSPPAKTASKEGWTGFQIFLLVLVIVVVLVFLSATSSGGGLYFSGGGSSSSSSSSGSSWGGGDFGGGGAGGSD